VCGFSAKIIKSGWGLMAKGRRFLSDAALHLFCLSWEGERKDKDEERGLKGLKGVGIWPQKIACQVKLLVCQRETG